MQINENINQNQEKEKDFLHFTISSYSFLQSMLKVKTLVSLAKQNNMQSVALIDDSNLFGSLEFNLEAVKNGIKPINGLAAKILINNILFSARLLAINEIGYKNLIKLASYIYLHNHDDNNKYININDLSENCDSLILIIDYIDSPITKYILKQINATEVDKIIAILINIFKENLYLAISRHKIKLETQIESEYLKLANKYNLPVIAVNNVLFPDIHSFEAHDILVCIADREKKANTERRCSNNQFYFKSSSEMYDLFEDLPFALQNNINLAKRCNFILKTSNPELPNFNNENLNEEEILEQESYKGLLEKLIYKSYSLNLQIAPSLINQVINALKKENTSNEDISNEAIKAIENQYNLSDNNNSTLFFCNFNVFNLKEKNFFAIKSLITIIVKQINISNIINATKINLESFDDMIKNLNFSNLINENVIDFHDVKAPLIKTELSILIIHILSQYFNYFIRLAYELSVICKMNFAGYFLIVSDFVRWSKENDVSVGPGRGSGAGAIVAWCLQITELDPIEYGLIFERFLNPERVSMPDFDIDFCQKNRERVINYVVNKYGESRVAQIITFGTLQAKAVIKDVGRSMNLPFRYANKLTELIPFNAVSPVTLEQAVNEVMELNLAYKGLGFYAKNDSGGGDKGEEDQENNLLMKEVLEYALKLEGLHRHASVHAAGIIIAKNPLIEKVALYKEEFNEMNTIQASMKYAESLGLVKFDFLGLQTLTLIADCCKLIKLNQGIELDIQNIPLNDAKTFEILSRADAIGVFQLEGGMVNVLKQIKPDSVRDIMALTALYRPGPMDNIQIYIDCKHKKQDAKYLHPKMQEILSETYGVIVYQEQVIELVKTLAGYSLSAADNLRRAMGKKNKQEMDMQRSIFTKGCKANGIEEKLAEEIFDSIEKFAGYGFNKAHAAAYALISYQTAYLKANYKLEFITTFLNLELHDHKKISALISYAKKSNIKILLPNINRPESMFTIDKSSENTIIFGLSAIKGLTGKTIEDIKTEHMGSNFTSIFDFLDRIYMVKNFNKKTLESLIKAGVFDSLEQNKKMLFENTDSMLKYMDQLKVDDSNSQLNFFDINESLSKTKENIFTKTNNWNIIEQLGYAFDVLGVFIELHPIEIYRKYFNLRFLNFSQIRNMQIGRHSVVLPGFIEAKFAKKSNRGKYLNLKLSDENDIFEISVYDEKILEQASDILVEKSLVIIECDLIISEGTYKLIAKTFIDINKYCNNMYKNLDLKIQTQEELKMILEYIKPLESQSGTHALNLFIKEGAFYFKIDCNTKFDFASADIIYLKQFNERVK